MPFTDEQVMLTLAGLTYRGFADPGAAAPSRPRAAPRRRAPEPGPGRACALRR